MPRASSSFIALSSAALSGMLALGCSSSPSSGRTTTDAGHQSDATSRVDASVRSDAGIVTVDAGGAIQYTVDAYVPVYDAGCGSASVVFPGGCGDPASDPHNCGSCGHDCDGGACFDGSCGALPEGVLATGQYMPTALFVDGENAYWRNEGFNIGHGKAPRVLGGQVMRCALAGCGNRPTPIGGADDSWLPRSVALDDDAVYWTNGESVVSCPKTGCGCAPQAVLTFDAPMEIAVHGSTVFFTDLSLTNVGSCPVTGCGTTPTILATRPVGPDGIVTDDASVYWTTGGWGVLTCGLGGCDGGPDTLWFPEFGETNTTGITVDATNVYWTNTIVSTGSVMQCAKNDCGGTLVTLATGRNDPRGVTVDGTDVYWAEENDFVKCAIGGCGGEPTTIASTQGIAVAVDSTNVYMAQQASPTDGWIVAQPK